MDLITLVYPIIYDHCLAFLSRGAHRMAGCAPTVVEHRSRANRGPMDQNTALLGAKRTCRSTTPFSVWDYDDGYKVKQFEVNQLQCKIEDEG